MKERYTAYVPALIAAVKSTFQRQINENNRKRLTNTEPTLICSNCTGGMLYHWLGLKFRSPFINLYMTPEDFITALEHFDFFISGEITEVKESGKGYPVGRACDGTYIHFMHYSTFAEAITAWNRRKLRMDMNNAGIMLANGGGY